EVWAGTQLSLERRVAIKVLPRELAEEAVFVERFRREAEAAAALHHPHIVQVTDFGRAPGGPMFLVMERLVGRSLRDVLRERRLAPTRACRLTLQILSALGAAHRAGIVHRDLKPANVFVVPLADGGEMVKLLDFGVAKLRASAGYAKLTQTGIIVGTPRHASPEQLEARPLDGRSDLFAAGGLLHGMLAGRPPFDAQGIALHRQVVEEDPPDVRIRAPDTPPGLVTVIERAMRKRPEERFPSAEAMAAAVAPFAEVSLEARRHSAPRRLAPVLPRTGDVPVAEEPGADGSGAWREAPTVGRAPRRDGPNDEPAAPRQAAPGESHRRATPALDVRCPDQQLPGDHPEREDVHPSHAGPRGADGAPGRRPTAPAASLAAGSALDRTGGSSAPLPHAARPAAPATASGSGVDASASSSSGAPALTVAVVGLLALGALAAGGALALVALGARPGLDRAGPPAASPTSPGIDAPPSTPGLDALPRRDASTPRGPAPAPGELPASCLEWERLVCAGPLAAHRCGSTHASLERLRARLREDPTQRTSADMHCTRWVAMERETARPGSPWLQRPPPSEGQAPPPPSDRSQAP
ncbi:MAG TPA: serine/threonine-protein kinase, partial [Sandaracinaceae bacterium LLY-WYZ-13_1]|nr:serine/threonine-protein kinase [Sandaracinaceae bacterium LLY-WYZ-13_1]